MNLTHLPGLRGSGRGGIIACGADMKSRFSVLAGDDYYVSGDYGDLAAAENYALFMGDVRQATERWCPAPEAVAFDLHPLYFSRRAADLFPGAERIGVQHHHAHIAGVLAQYEDAPEVLGVAFDGTGYGEDGNLWGGEFLVVSRAGYRRAGRLAYLKMPGGEAAVRQPWRLAFSLLYEHLGDRIFDSGLSFMTVRAKPNYTVLKNLLYRDIVAPKTSSCGRLFDAVSALLGVTQTASFEGEAAINLEKKVSSVRDDGWYPFGVTEENGVFIAGYRVFLDALTADLNRGVAVEIIARRFHNSVARLIAEMLVKIRAETKIQTAVLSGGVFQNRLLSSLAVELLKKEGFRLLENPAVPVNDLGICVGQTFAALYSQK